MQDPARLPRRAQPLPAEVASHYRVPSFEELSVAAPRLVDGIEIVEGKLRVGEGEHVIKLYVPQRDDRREPMPFVLALPIMAGGRTLLDMLCMELARQGFASGHIERRGNVLKPIPVEGNPDARRYETPREINDGLVEVVREQRAFLAWIAGRPEFDAQRIGCLGMSLGGIVAGILVAVEPRIRAATLVLAGGDLPSLFVDTNLGRARRWGRANMGTSKLDVRGFQRLLATELRADPARLARYVSTNRVLLVSARYDTVIPLRNARVLWEAFGRPRWVTVPFEHYSAALAFHWIVRQAARHSRRRFD